MAEVQAAQTDAPKDDVKQDAPSTEQTNPDTGRTYTQADLDRITAKVRKNAMRDAELRMRREAQPPPPPKDDAPPPPKQDEEPKREAFDDYESYQRAVAQFEGRKATREELAKADKEKKETAEREVHEKAARTWHGKIEQAIAKLPDFEDVLEDNEETLTVIGNAPMRAFITESDIGPQIIHHLCKTPEGRADAKRIAALPAYKQAAEISKIEDTLLAAAGKPTDDQKDDPKDDEPAADGKADGERNPDGTFKSARKETPKGPPEPIEPVASRSGNKSGLPSDSDDAETWRRKEIARMNRLKAGN